ncbi:hypothetical protein BKA65DRAFT_551885 [Rhexocercosporidium sp. MPI-PUGE-AT-0058]|nr:hypothetical protein BKA65DRAFT_551885 [Rhexocercosporidium sp. MPI-PUGE-AT-0058]
MSPVPSRREPAASITVVDARVASAGHERRIAQNKDSQRAFRDRKSKELAILLANIPRLEDQHRILLQSYSNQSAVIHELRVQLEALTGKMSAILGFFNLPLPEAPGSQDVRAGYSGEEDVSSVSQNLDSYFASC